MEQNSAYVFSKTVTQYFSPNQFFLHNNMSYTSSNVNYFRYQILPFIRSMTYEIEQINVTTNSNKLYDSSSTERTLSYYTVKQNMADILADCKSFQTHF